MDIKLAVALAFSILLSGCDRANTSINQGLDAPRTSDPQKIVGEVEAKTRLACGYLPDADPILKLIPTIGGVASDIANAICNAVAKAAPAAGGAGGAPTLIIVQGVIVTGTFVNR